MQAQPTAGDFTLPQARAASAAWGEPSSARESRTGPETRPASSPDGSCLGAGSSPGTRCARPSAPQCGLAQTAAARSSGWAPCERSTPSECDQPVRVGRRSLAGIAGDAATAGGRVAERVAIDCGVDERDAAVDGLALD